MSGPILFATPPGAAPAQAAAPTGATPYTALAQIAAPAPAWTPPAAIAGPQATGVSLPIEIPLGSGYTVRAYMHFGPEYAHPQAAADLAIQLANAGLLKPFAPRQERGFGNDRGNFDRGRSFGGDRGSYGGDRGGYGHGGGNRGGWR